jgi:hypothetical protein
VFNIDAAAWRANFVCLENYLNKYNWNRLTFRMRLQIARGMQAETDLL